MESLDTSDPLRPRLLLFLSVDVVGSTAYKNRREEGVRPWLPFFEDFYKEFPVFFQGECDENDTAQLWKSLGDELIFVAKLKSHQQADKLVSAFKRAIEKYSKIIRNKELPLALKASGWTAGFPVANAELRSQATQDLAKIAADYIGPSIDVGFRLSKFASVRKFVVSVELAIFLTARTASALEFRLGELHSLKGVLDDRPYPIIWIDMYAGMPDELEVQSEKLIARGTVDYCNIQHLNKYCRDFIERCGKPLMIPFIVGDHDFGTKPDKYDEDLAKLRLVTSRRDEEGHETGFRSEEGENQTSKVAALVKGLTKQPSPNPTKSKPRRGKKTGSKNSLTSAVRRPVRSKRK